MAAAGHKPGFRPDIEGLRGISIGSVVLYHAGDWVRGGFTGVDVFFVLSGFLITGILLGEHAAQGRIRLMNFWSRRVRRILPQATLVLLVTLSISLFFVPALLLESVGRDLASASYFALNWRAAGRAVDYSDPGNDLTPVLHFWSLAVEEQFYLAWPLLLSLLLYLDVRRSKGHHIITLVIGAMMLAASVAYCAIETHVNQPLAFFSTFSRIWQLLTGAMIAAWISRGTVCSAGVARWLGPAGLLLVLAGFVFINGEQGAPFPVSVLAVLGSASIIYAGTARDNNNAAAKLLSWGPLMYVGRVSYAWYLWHWPALYFGHIVFPTSRLAVVGAAVGASFGLSVLTYHVFETPIRFHPGLVRSSRKSIGMGLSFVGVSALAAFGLIAISARQTIILSSGEQLVIRKIIKDRSSAYKLDCHASQLEVTHRPCRFGPADVKADVVLFGDSHAAQFFDPLRRAAEQQHRAILMRSKSGCAAIRGKIWNRKFKRVYEECETWKAGVLATIAREKPKLVIVSNATAYDMFDEEAGSPVSGEKAARLYRSALQKMIRTLLASAEDVVLIKDTPRLPEEPVNCLASHPRDEGACSWRLSTVSTGDRFVPDLFEFGSRVKLVDVNDVICRHELCSAIREGRPVFYDVSHLTATFALNMAPLFERMLADTPR